MEISDLKQNLIVRDDSRKETLKVSTIYSPTRVTAQVVFPVPQRTTVREYTGEQVQAWREVTEREFNQYDQAYPRLRRS